MHGKQSSITQQVLLDRQAILLKRIINLRIDVNALFNRLLGRAIPGERQRAASAARGARLRDWTMRGRGVTIRTS